MTKQTSPTALAALQFVGFTSEDDLYAAIANATAAERAVLSQLMMAFNQLGSAERAVCERLDGVTRTAEVARTNLDTGSRLDATWVLEHARQLAKHAAEIDAAIATIQGLAAIWKALASN